MADMKVIAVGDSVVWGQGLQHGDKFVSRFFQQLTGAVWPEEELRAHSGASIDFTRGGPQTSAAQVADRASRGEVPVDVPTIREQVQAIGTEEGAQTTVVVVNGGINDVAINTIGLNLPAENELEAAIRQACYDRMLSLLRNVRAKCPHAVVLVLGYYPIISDASAFDKMKLFVTLQSLFPFATPDLFVRKAARNFVYFHMRSLYWLRRVVTDVHDDAGLRGPGVVFVHPAFGAQNSVGANNSFLFEPNPPPNLALWIAGIVNAMTRGDQDRLLIEVARVSPQDPNDPVYLKRKDGCKAVFANDLWTRMRCLVAANGHPNAAGAQRYADAMVERYTHYNVLAVRAHIQHLTHGAGTVGVKATLERYGLDPGRGLRACMQHMLVDCIEVTITTKSKPFAGTDDDVYFSVGGDRRWLLNEDIFALDITNDFEAGSTGTYTIDPTLDPAHGPLHLGDIAEIRLTKASPLGFAGDWEPSSIIVQVNGLEILNTDINVQLTGRRPTWVATHPSYPAGMR